MYTEKRVSRRQFIGATAAGGVIAAEGRQILAAHDSRNPDDLAFKSATAIRDLIRNRQVTPVDVVKRYLQRIGEIDDFLNAVTYLPKEQALLDEAAQIEREIDRGNIDWDKQPLLGVPVSIKDMFDVAGMPNTCGSRVLENNIATEDATAVAKLRQSGAIILARTNMPLDGAAFETDNLLHGRTNNPYDKLRTPGGSSGGEAALIAAGGSPLGLGGDSGGSIIVPGHCCGIAGLVPAWGRVSTAGVLPFIQNNGPFYLGCGPMARRVEDLALMLPIICGEDHRDSFTFPLQKPRDAKGVNLASLKIAWCTEARNLEPTPDIKDSVRDAANQLQNVCSLVRQALPPYFDDDEPMSVVAAFSIPHTEEGVAQMREGLNAIADPLIREGAQLALQWLAERDLAKNAKVHASLPTIQRRMLQFMHQHDVLLTPVCQEPAWKHGESWRKILKGETFFTAFFKLFGNLPVGVVRCGTSPEGLPISVQVVGAPYREDYVLAVMEFLEEELGGWLPPSEESIRALPS